MKNNFKTLGKFLSQLFCVGALLGGTACTDDDVTGSGNVPLQVSVTANSPLVSRAIVTDEYLPDGSTIGVSLFAADGSSYDNQNYFNVKYTAAGTGDAQVWTGASDVSLSGNPATVVAYYPWQEVADLTAVPVETATQTDYMWAETLTGVANTNPGVELAMNHALTAVRVKLVLGDYTGSVDVSDISVSSPALGTAASLDVLGGEGALADITGQGDAVAFDVDFDLTAEGTSTDVMLVPDASVASGKTVVAATIGGKKFSAGIAFDESYKQGYIYTYTITLNNKGFEVIKVAVTPWQDGGLKESEFEPEKDDTYVVKIGITNDNSVYIHNVKGIIGTIDWGDGTVETFDEVDLPEHTYLTAGEYIVTVKGTTGMISSRNAGYAVSTPYILELIHIGKDMEIWSMADAFMEQSLYKIHENAIAGCQAEDFSSAFYLCDNLQEIPEGLFDGCPEVMNFGFAFCGTGITSIPEGLFDHCTEVTSFYGTFQGCESLKEIPVGLFDNCTKVTNFGVTFQRCTSLTGESPYTVIQVDGVDTKVHLYERSAYPEVFTAPTRYNWCFKDCSGLTDYVNVPEGWK